MSHTTKYSQYTKRYLDHRGALVSGHELEGIETTFKFGHNDSIGQTYAVVSEGGLCRLPLPANATTLRIKAGGDAADDAAGAGARSILLQGIDETGADIQEVLVTNGVDASLSTVQTFMRLYRSLVIETGTYATDFLTGGQAATITIENTAGTADWMMIRYNGFADCQSQSNCFSVGTGKRAYLSAINIFVDSVKSVDFLLVFRANFMNVSAFQPVRVGSELNGVSGAFNFAFPEPPRFYEHTDIALVAKVTAGSAAVSANMVFITNSNGPADPP